MRILLCLLACAAQVFAESPVIFGARGGIPFNTTDVISQVGGPTLRYTIGPTLGVRLPVGLSVEGDALYTRQTLNLGQLAGINLTPGASSWQFPVMLKFTAGKQFVAPVVGAGVAVRHTNDFSSIPSFIFSGSTAENTVGFVAGAGIRFKAGPVKITPEFRYTYWGAGNLSDAVAQFLPFSRHEATVLLGLTF